ncbi:MAG: signal peptide peptidase SppA [Candidatus Coatesbacteria bacterium]|nr:signal peptide peptidase SppA [Candidatus Coatesbacteria bacterium]
MKKSIFMGIILLLCLASVVIGLMMLQKGTPRYRESSMDRIAGAVERRLGKFEPRIGPGVGLIRVFGAITYSESQGFLEAYPRGALRTIRELRQLRKDEDVKAIVIQINSPGGTVGSVQEICHEIKLAREAGKKVIASVADMAFSGGYYIASACDEIIANPGSLTGSIGVIIVGADLQRLLEMLGIKFNVIKSGKHKDIMAYWRDMTDEERNLLQTLIMDCYQQFVSAVSEGRGISIEQVLPLADGRIFSGVQAIENHLIDSLGTLDDALRRAADLSGIKGDPNIIYPTIEPFEHFFRFLDARFGKKALLGDVVGVEFDSPIQYRADIGAPEAAFIYPNNGGR